MTTTDRHRWRLAPTGLAIVLVLALVTAPAAPGRPKGDGSRQGSGSKGSSSTTTVTLTPSTVEHGEATCLPSGSNGTIVSVPSPTYVGWQCNVERWGYVGRMGVKGYISSGIAVSPVPVTTRASMSNGAVHELAAPATSITYSWTFGRYYPPPYANSTITPASLRSVALTMTAAHRSCPSCTVSARQILAGSDQPSGPGTTDEQWSPVTVAVTLVNSDGGAVPTGTIDVVARLDLLQQTDGVWQGWADARAELVSVELTAARR